MDDEVHAAGGDRPHWVLAALAVAAGAIHLAMVPSHVDAWAVEGVAFAVVGWLQLAAAVALVLRPSRPLLLALAVGSTLVVLVWLLSRTAGLPVGPHAGDGESASFVDLVAAGVEVALVVGIVLGHRLHVDLRRLTPVPVLAVLALATVAMVSPSARDHAHTGHDDEVGHDRDDRGTGEAASLAGGHTHVDDFKPYVPMDAATFKRLGEELETVRRLTMQFPTVADAKAAGFTRRGRFVPGQGAHFFPPFSVLRSGRSPIERPISWLYAGLDDTSPVVGVMYTGAMGVDFAGPNDRWHHHDDVCTATTPSPDGGFETLSEAEGITAARCSKLGGQYHAKAGPLMHVWAVPGWESPIGVFSHDNPLVACTDGKKPGKVTHSNGGCKGLA